MKCPNCNSSRYHENNGKACCDRCGFENIKDIHKLKSIEEDIQELKKK